MTSRKAAAQRPASSKKRQRGAAASGLDPQGILIAFKEAQMLYREQEVALIGKVAETPAEVLLSVALDRSKPLPLRMAAAKDAAPYYDRRQPMALDGGLGKDGEPLPLFDPSRLSTEELTALSALLSKAGVAAAVATAGGEGG